MRAAPWVRGLLALAALRLLFAAFVPVTPEEAYHWNFGQHLDWSYYDHPGMIAWSIRLGCAIFGDTALGIRFFPVLFATGTAALLARLARRLYGEPAAAWAVLLISVNPIAFLAGGSGFPDSPLLFFWALAMMCVAEALETGGPRSWIVAGVALGCMGLSKYTGVFFGVAVLLHLVTSARDRRWLLTPWPYVASVLALALLWPVFHWNAAHELASFKFQAGRVGETRPPSAFGAFLFLGEQWAGMIPFTLPLAVVALPRAWRSKQPAERFLFWCFVPMVAFFFAVSSFRFVHLMWPMPAFLSLTVLMAGAAVKAEGRVAQIYSKGRAWLAGVTAGAYVLGAIHLAFFLPWFSPVQGMYGWEKVAAKARELRAGMPEGTFYLGLGRKYTCPSQLAFRIPAPFDVHGKNLVGEMGSQYDYWADLPKLAGRDAVVVLEEGDRSKSSVEQIKSAFASVEPAGDLIMPVGRHPILEVKPLRFRFFVGRGYKEKK
jgi:4-amino-4-deoxy-L-arabinose transferase-like glycosyltransferase